MGCAGDAGPECPSVLVIDDNVGFLRVVRALLESGSPAFSVHTAETGEAALSFLRREGAQANAPRPAFVVLDYRLPDLNAPEVMTRIRQEPDLAALPVLVLSQAAWAEDATAALAAGAQRFIAKPSKLEELRETICAFWREMAPPR